MAVTLIKRISVEVLVLLITVYRNTISPLFPPSCRYTPTCSQYAIDALRKYGFFVGLYRAIKRVLRCHPYATHSSYDPA